MSKVLVNEASLSAIGDAIRSKNGTATKYKPGEMAAAISALSAGSGGGDGLEVTYAVTAIEASAFEGNADITSVSIPESVASVGASAFADCVNMTDIYFGAADIPDLDYGKGVFKCAGKNGDGISVVIGNKVKRLPAYAFYGGVLADSMAKVKTVEFEEGSVCTEIGDWAFYYCMELDSFVAPATLERLGSWALFTVNHVDVLDFSACTQIPTLSRSDDLVASTIYVPAALYDEWIVATNWAAYADRIIAK